MKDTWHVLGNDFNFEYYDSMTDRILKIRGITNKEQFLNPRETDLHSPWELSNMQTTVEKIAVAIRDNLNIGIYADIDTDGVTSATIMYKYLKNFNVEPVILYHQRKDNHGVIINVVPKNLNLLIIVDSSSNNAKECSVLCKTMDIIILDHHLFERKNPYAVIVNPNYNDYPNKELSGAGVVYQTCRAIDEIMFTNYAEEYIDIACVGLIGDVMNVTSPETRYLIYKGLIKIQSNCDKNLLAILKSLKKEYKPNTSTIAYYVVPFINAIIRLGKIENILEILTTDDEKKLKELIKLCGSKNDERKEIQSEIMDEINNLIDLSHKIIILDVTELSLNKTMNGVIASNIAQKYQKPALVVSLDTGTNMLNGSGRGYGNTYDLLQLLSDTGLFESIGGHSRAFGVEFKPENLPLILEKVNNALKQISQEFRIDADLLINVSDITWDLANEMQRLSFITGNGFREPVFALENVPIGDIKVMKDIHLKFNVEDIECIKFNMSEDEIENVKNALCIDILGSIGINSWYNFGTKETVKTKQIMVKDINIY